MFHVALHKTYASLHPRNSNLTPFFSAKEAHITARSPFDNTKTSQSSQRMAALQNGSIYLLLISSSNDVNFSLYPVIMNTCEVNNSDNRS